MFGRFVQAGKKYRKRCAFGDERGASEADCKTRPKMVPSCIYKLASRRSFPRQDGADWDATGRLGGLQEIHCLQLELQFITLPQRMPVNCILSCSNQFIKLTIVLARGLDGAAAGKSAGSNLDGVLCCKGAAVRVLDDGRLCLDRSQSKERLQGGEVRREKGAPVRVPPGGATNARRAMTKGRNGGSLGVVRHLVRLYLHSQPLSSLDSNSPKCLVLYRLQELLFCCSWWRLARLQAAANAPRRPRRSPPQPP